MSKILLVSGKFLSFKDDDTGNSGGFVYTYEVGTSTPKTTYSDSALSVPNANPVVLNSAGRADIYFANDCKITVQDSAANLIYTKDNVNPAAASLTSSISSNTTLTGTHNNYVIEATTAITISLTAANTLGAGWSAKIINNSSGVVTVTRLGGGDTINGTAADAAIGSYGSAEFFVNAAATGFVMIRPESDAKGTDIASASTLTIQDHANYYHVTGTVTVTGLAAGTTGRQVTLNFTGALLLTYNATSLILPTSANITTAAGDVASFACEGTTNWRCVSYTRRSGFMLQMASPAFTGTPTSTTAAHLTSTTQIATTEFVQNEIGMDLDTTSVGTKCFGLGNFTQNKTSYMGALGFAYAVGNDTETNYEFWPQHPVTLSHLYISASALAPAGQTFSVTVRKNGAATSIAAQITDAIQDASDTVDTVDLWPGDRFSIQAISSATSGSANDLKASLRIRKIGTTIGSNEILFSGGGGSTHGEWGSVATLANSEMLMPNVVIGRASDASLSIYKNGATVQTSGQTHGTYNAFYNGTTDTFTTSGAAGPSRQCVATFPTRNTWGAYPGKGLIFFAGLTPTGGATRFLGGWQDTTISATEADVSVPISAGTIKNLRVCCEATPGASIVVTVRKNGVSAGITCTLGAGGRTASDLVNTSTFAAGDKLSISAVNSTGSNRTIAVNVEHVA